MRLVFTLIVLLALCSAPKTGFAQRSYSNLARLFINSLNDEQKKQALYPFESNERYDWHFVPKEDRKGVYLKELASHQQDLAFNFLKAYLSSDMYKKTQEIMELELVLRELEKRKEGEWMRDPGRYAFIFFGTPSAASAWGWRFEGHHISLSFSTLTDKIISGTPGFIGANPAIVLSGPQKGKQVLKKESDHGFKLVQSLSPLQLQKATVAGETPNDILTYVSREARIEKEEGINYKDLSKSQQDLFVELLKVYVNRYTKKYAKDLMKEITKADINKLRFAWAGATQPEFGKAHYYRIQGPSIIIEFDNSQNNANHIHTVVRDLKYDFGGDKLLEHYKKGHNH